jgi:hypothetical protein
MTDDRTPAVPEPAYELTLKGAGLTIERKIPESIALSVVALIMGGDGSRIGPRRGGSVAAASLTATGSRQGLATTVGEFLTEVEAKRNPDKILTFAAYLMDEMGRESVTRDEIRSMFQKAAEPVPGNFHRDFTWAVQNRWLGEQPGSPGAYYVTKTGRTALGNKFAAEVKASTKLTRRRRTRKAGATGATNGGESAS